MKSLKNRIFSLLRDERGASNVEIIVWISVVLVISTTLFLFKDAIVRFIQKAIGAVDSLEID